MIQYKIIENLGLNHKEAMVYVSCLQCGPITISELAKNTNIQRTHLYDLAKKLASKGFLVQTKKEDKKLFSAQPPEKILIAKKAELKNFEDSIPELKKLNNKKDQRPKITYYEGVGEIEKMMEGATSKHGEYLIFSDDLFYTKDDKEYQKKNIEQRLKAKISCQVLATLTNAALESKKRDKKEFRETRLLPKDLFEAKVHLAMHKNKTLVVNHAKNFGFVVEDREFSDTLKAIFNLIWNSGRLIK